MLKSTNFIVAAFFTLSLALSICICVPVLIDTSNLKTGNINRINNDYDFISNFHTVPHLSDACEQDEIITNIPYEITSNSKFNFDNAIFVVPRI